MTDVIWRVAGREGGWFTVELAAFADGGSLLDQLTAREVKVTPDGREERDDGGERHEGRTPAEDRGHGNLSVGGTRDYLPAGRRTVTSASKISFGSPRSARVFSIAPTVRAGVPR